MSTAGAVISPCEEQKVPSVPEPIEATLHDPTADSASAGITDSKYLTASSCPVEEQPATEEKLSASRAPGRRPIAVSRKIVKNPPLGERLIMLFSSVRDPCVSLCDFSQAAMDRIVNEVNKAAVLSIITTEEHVKTYFISIVGHSGTWLTQQIAVTRYSTAASTVTDNEIIRASLPDDMPCGRSNTCKRKSIFLTFIYKRDEVDLSYDYVRVHIVPMCDGAECKAGLVSKLRLDRLKQCSMCSKTIKEIITEMKCVHCKLVQYCSRKCRRAHLDTHREVCKAMRGVGKI